MRMLHDFMYKLLHNLCPICDKCKVFDFLKFVLESVMCFTIRIINEINIFLNFGRHSSQCSLKVVCCTKHKELYLNHLPVILIVVDITSGMAILLPLHRNS